MATTAVEAVDDAVLPRLAKPRRLSFSTGPFASRVTRLVCVAGVLDAILFFFLRPDVNDLWAARARASAVKDGVGLTYWFSWFGGGSTPGNYSVVTPWLAARIGTETLCALAAALIPFLVAMLVRGTHHPRAATAIAAIVVGANLWSGRVPFLLSAAFGLGALVFFRARAVWPALVLMAVSIVASPTVGAFAALGLGGVFLSWPARRRQAGVLIVVIGAAMLAITKVFGSPGPEPFDSSLRVQLICALLLLQLARPTRWVRTTLWLSVIAVLVLSNVDNAMGSNLARWVWFCLPVVVVALSRFNAFFVTLIVTPLVIGGWNMTYIDLRNAVQPVSSTQYYAPLAAELDLLPGLVNHRLEVVDHGAHAAYDALLNHANLARGWETQDDVELNYGILDGHLAATTYKVWLDNNAVGYVALPASTVATYGEYNLVSQNTPSYLQEIWQNADWKLYEVNKPTGIVPAPAQVVRTSQASIVIDVPCACTINVRVHYSKYLEAVAPAGSTAKLTEDGSTDGGSPYTNLTTTAPGTYRLQGKIG